MTPPRPSPPEAGRGNSGLPDFAAFFAFADHRVPGLAFEGFGELREVRERAVDAVLRDRVRVALDHGALRFGADLVATPLAPRDEELLLGREAVDGRLGALPFAGFLVGEERDLRAGEVADRFAEHELAVVVEDRKSTRLNSSHSQISYAVFCLK